MYVIYSKVLTARSHFPTGYQPDHFSANRKATLSNRVPTGRLDIEPEGTFVDRIPTGPLDIEPEGRFFRPDTNRTPSHRTGRSHFDTGYQPDHFASNRKVAF